jgi:hypothetical protein
VDVQGDGREAEKVEMTAAAKPAKIPKEPKSVLQCPNCVYAKANMPAFIKHLMQVHALRPNQILRIVQQETKGKMLNRPKSVKGSNTKG